MDKLNSSARSEINNPAWNDCTWDDWQFYIPTDIQAIWSSLNEETRMVAYAIADAVADAKAKDAEW